MLLQTKTKGSCSLLKNCVILYTIKIELVLQKHYALLFLNFKYYVGSTTENWNDKIKSIDVGPKTKITLYKHKDFEGTAWLMTNNNDSSKMRKFNL